MKIAILDDYLHQSRIAADWSKLAATCEIIVFDRPLAVPDEAAPVTRSRGRCRGSWIASAKELKEE